MWGLGTDVGTGKPDLNNQIFLYKGQYGCVTDTETNLVYCHHRYYNPYSARWLTRDPAGLEGGINTYQYCEGNPITRVDPSGTVVIMVVSYRVLSYGWHRGIVVLDNIGKKRAFSFAGDPQFPGRTHHGLLIRKSGPWRPGTQDYNGMHEHAAGDMRVITLINDDSSYNQWIDKFNSIEAYIASQPGQDYGPLPSDFHLWGGKTVNSNTWTHYLLRQAGPLGQYERAITKLHGHDLPLAPGWNIKVPFNDAPKR